MSVHLKQYMWAKIFVSVIYTYDIWIDPFAQ